MNLSPSFLLGLGVLLLSDQLVEWLPGEADVAGLLVTLPLLPVPALLAAVVGRRARARAVTGLSPNAALRAAFRAAGAAVPLCYFVLLAGGGLADLAARWAPGSTLLNAIILVAPLLFLELSLRLVERRTVDWFAARRIEPPSPLGHSRLWTSVFLIVPLFLFATGLDLIERHRWFEVFFRATAVGATSGLILTVVALCVLLPLLFRALLPTRRRLPSHLDGDLRATVARLGFPPNRLLSMKTGLRMVNAALVGPLRWPRYLVLTDGILAYLDRIALRGVVAHEVGHARAGHPSLLLIVFAGLPVLLLQPSATLDLEGIQPWILVATGGALALGAFVALRALMHRFEFEADQLSAVALGGALPCITALQRVGDLFPAQRGKPSFRHPSEEQRIQSLLAWETDRAYRVAFTRRGRMLRAAIALVVIAAGVLSAWAHVRAWPLDRVVLRLYTGDFRGAAEAVGSLAPDDSGNAQTAAELREEVDAATDLAGAGGPWKRIRDDLADRAWQRGLDVLVRDGAHAARPYLALALSGGATDPVRESAFLWCRATVDEDEARAARIAAHLIDLGELPPGLRQALGA